MSLCDEPNDLIMICDFISSWLLSVGCPVGYFGKDCNKVCRCPIGIACHRQWGSCLCKPGFFGPQCNSRKYTYPVFKQYCMSHWRRPGFFNMHHGVTGGSTPILCNFCVACHRQWGGLLWTDASNKRSCAKHVCVSLHLVHSLNMSPTFFNMDYPLGTTKCPISITLSKTVWKPSVYTWFLLYE